jgi:hypothetical protein
VAVGADIEGVAGSAQDAAAPLRPQQPERWKRLRSLTACFRRPPAARGPAPRAGVVTLETASD